MEQEEVHKNEKESSTFPYLPGLFFLVVSMSIILAGNNLFFRLPNTPLVKKLRDGRLTEKKIERFDLLLEQLPENGNIYLQCDVSQQKVSLCDRLYYTWSYKLYPRKLFVTTTGRRISNSEDMIQIIGEIPEKIWLKKNDVTAWLKIKTDMTERTSISFIKL